MGELSTPIKIVFMISLLLFDTEVFESADALPIDVLNQGHLLNETPGWRYL